jgi:hypothetical protein
MVSLRWAAFWALLSATAAVGEGVAIYENGSTDSLSAQVWYVLDLSPAVWSIGLILFAGVGVWLVQHFFFGRRGFS